MSANKKSRLVLLGLLMAVACLLGVFAIMDASSANASAWEVPLPTSNLESSPIIVINPLALSATVPADGVQTETLTITNEGGDLLNFSLHEITRTRQLLPAPVKFDMPDRFQSAGAPQVDAGVHSQLLFMNKSWLIIYLRGEPDLSAAYGITNRAARVQYVYDRLLELATQSDDLYNWLLSQGTQPHRLLLANAIAATLNDTQLIELEANPQVKRIGINESDYTVIDGSQSAVNLASMSKTVEWNIAKIRANEAWQTFGVTGQGEVVGVIDTGVMYNHAALVNSYRGNLGGGSFDHNYNWYDFVNHQPVPYDDNGHGTFGTGIVTGNDGGENQIGVAPGADWVAVKVCSAIGSCDYVNLLDGLEWMLAPTRLDGTGADPSMAPNIVLGMWGGGTCDPSFEPILETLRAANILPVFAPGASGPSCGSVSSPGDLPVTLAAGATDQNDLIAPFSARGPGCFGGIKPDVSAPGVNIRSSAISGNYETWSGTSFSTAHTAGAAVMILSADPSMSINELLGVLYSTAVCIDDQTCSSGASCPEPNNTYGHGRIDVYEAVAAVMGQPYDIPWLNETSTSGSLDPGQNASIEITFNATGLEPGIYTGGISVESNDPLAPFTSLPVTLTVTAPCEPVTNLSAAFTPPDPAVGEVVTFTASASGSLPINFTWVFADGSSTPGQEVTYVFDTHGPQFVGLTAENACDIETVDFAVPVEAVMQRILLPMVSR